MDRRKFIRNTAAGSALGLIGGMQGMEVAHAETSHSQQNIRPRAITMWDFSWLERRWPGAGYEDWDQALDELKVRGYDAVRIDAYPHLVAENPTREWTLNECWNTQVWGSPDVNKVSVQPNLNTFIGKCRDRGIKVGLSTWFREDADKTRMKILTADIHAEIWIKTLKTISDAGLLDNILYVDLCNEWPGDAWAPFFKNVPPDKTWGYWHTKTSMDWIRKAISLVRQAYPGLMYCFSFDNQDVERYVENTPSFMDLAEHHVWMVKSNDSEFYKLTGYDYQRFSPSSYKNLVSKAKPLYDSKPQYWQEQLIMQVRWLGLNAQRVKLPLITTECWSVVDYKDWPLLEWDWIKELCALGATTAASTGQWIAIATSNFCGPQFVGMWRDVQWHKDLTDKIKASVIKPELLTEKVKKALG
ncbi:MAG: cellulase-like family protein [Bacteroidales bacterium]